MTKERIKVKDLSCENIECGYLDKENSLCTVLCQRDAWERRETCAERMLNGAKVKE